MSEEYPRALSNWLTKLTHLFVFMFMCVSICMHVCSVLKSEGCAGCPSWFLAASFLGGRLSPQTLSTLLCFPLRYWTVEAGCSPSLLLSVLGLYSWWGHYQAFVQVFLCLSIKHFYLLSHFPIPQTHTFKRECFQDGKKTRLCFIENNVVFSIAIGSTWECASPTSKTL